MIHDHLDARIRHRPAEVIIRLNHDLDFFSDAKRLALPIFFRRFHADFEFGQLVFLQAEQRGGADAVLPAFVPELHAVLAKRHGLGQFKRSPRATERVEPGLVRLHLRAARVGDFKFDGRGVRRGIDRAVVTPGDKLPLHCFLGPIRRSVGEGVNLPRLGLSAIPIAVAGAERLAIFRDGAGEEFEVVVLPGGQIKHRDAVRAGFLRLVARVPRLAVVPAFPKFHLGVGERRAVQCVAEISQCLLTGGFQNQRGISDEDQFARVLAAGFGFQQVSAGLEFGVETKRFIAGSVIVGRDALLRVPDIRADRQVGPTGRFWLIRPRLDLLQ